MVANCDRACPFSRRVVAVASALAIGISLSAAAQSAPASKISTDAQTYSSSAAYQVDLNSTDALLGAAPAAPVANASPQYGGHNNNYPSYNNYSSTWSHIAVDLGGGFTAPIGNDTSYNPAVINTQLSPSEGWGYNINVGGGWNFTKTFGALLEYQFNREDMAGDYLNALNAAQGTSSTGETIGGNINTWSLTLDPVYYIPYSQGSGFFVTAGGGFYRKVTNFTEPECEEDIYYGYICENATAYHFSSNQGGINAGFGWYHKVFGPDSNGKFYAEVRYVWVNSPTANSSNYYQGEGTEGLIPVTFGVRF